MGKKRKDIKSIFSEALEKRTAKERAAYLDRVCGDDSDLRAEFESLLKEHGAAGGFLESPALGADATLDNAVLEGPGTQIGRYELLDMVGEGGMGLVYLAEQKEPVRRKVALKIIKPGMDSRQVIARFEAERQALALLDHSNIARVLDAATTETGRPYFVMEYVKGMSITKYCDRHKLSVEKRLKLFLRVCEAVHHAHQKGIIHRDIKPSNILVSVQDDRAVPKIIDFGIAKAIAQPLTQQTLFTRQGQLLGTPEYMSPEQADMDNEDTDTRADIYSLGVVLYELLTGVLPFEHEALEKVGFAELQRILQEEEPPRPSLRFTALGEEAKEIAERRHTQVIALARRLHRELEWIPLKAMRKDRSRRYRSASELADDIQNYLSGAPLIAGPETAIYRVKKFVRRHTGSVVTAALVAAVIVLGLIISTAMYLRAEKALEKEAVARNVAEEARGIAEEAQTAEAQQRQIAEEQAENYRRSLYFNRIALADVAYRDDSMHRVRELLEECPEDLREWEWNHLNHISSDQSYIALLGHTGGVWGVAISPDGKRIASGSDDNTVKVWDAEAGTELMTLRGHVECVYSVSFSPDSKRIVSASKDKTVKLWDAATGTDLITLRGHEGNVYSVVFSPDGKRIASGDHDKTIKIWDAVTGVELMTLRGHEAPIIDASFSLDSQRIVSGGIDDTLKVWDANNGSELMTLRGHNGNVFSVAFSRDGKRIISGSWDNTVKVWDAETGEEIMTLQGHKDRVYDISFSPDGRQIVSGSRDRTVKLWDAVTGNELMTLRGHKELIPSVAFSPDGKRIISGSLDKTIKVWDIAIDRRSIHFGHNAAWTVDFSPDGKHILSGSPDGILTVWERSSGAELMILRGREDGLSSAGFSPDGKRIFACQYETVKIWDLESGLELMTLHEKERWPGATFSPDGTRIAYYTVDSEWESYDDTIKLYDAITGEELMILHGHRVHSARFSPDGKHIVSRSEDGTITIWDAITGVEIKKSQVRDDGGVGARFSPDDKHIRVVKLDRTIKILDASTGAEITTLPENDRYIRSIALSPNNRRIVVGDEDGMVKVWDTETGSELMTLRGYGREDSLDIPKVIFSPDGKTIAIGGSSGITLLESEVPADGYQAWRIGVAARKVADTLHKEQGLYSEVIETLKADDTLEESVRKLALQIANARRWEDADTLNKESWEVVSLPNGNIETYQEALEEAKKAKDFEPDNWSILNTLGVGQYRVGSYDQAVVTLTRAGKIRADKHPEPDHANVAFTAMALYRLDRTEEAQGTIEKLRGLFKEKESRDEKELYPFLFETEKLLAGENTKLYSAWEHIEKEDYEKVLQLVEELRSLTDRENIEINKQIKGAVKWLGRMYYNSAEGRGRSDTYTQVFADYEAVTAIDPEHSGALNELAWLRTICPVDDLRDGVKAVKEATKACELTDWKKHDYLSTLAAAYSEENDFTAAVKWQKRAIELLPEEKFDKWQANYYQRLKLYESGKSYLMDNRWSFSEGELVSWWKFDKTDGSEVVDSSGNGLDGKLNGSAKIITDPERGNVLSLDGNDSFVDCVDNSAFDITASITVAVWIKVNAFDKEYQSIVTRGLYSWMIYREGSTNNLSFFCEGLSNDTCTSITGNVDDGKWHHVVGTYDGQKLCLYIDGNINNSVNATGLINLDQEDVYIGTMSKDISTEFNGLIDDVRIYSYALSPEEIAAIRANESTSRVETVSK